MTKRTKWSVTAVLVLALAAAGCTGAKPFTPAAIDEIPPGPELFIGKDGEIKVAR